MVKLEGVEKCQPCRGLDTLLENTVASIKSFSNMFNSVSKVNLPVSANARKGAGLWGFEKLREPEDFEVFFRNSVSKIEVVMDEIKYLNPDCDLAMVCDELFDTLYKVRNSAKLVMLIHPQKEFVDVAKRVYYDANQYTIKFYTNHDYYSCLKRAAETKRDVAREPVDDFVIEKFLRAFEKGEKKMIVKNVLLKSCRKRQWLQRLFCKRPNECYTVLRKRLELARLYGFDTYAEFALSKSIPGTPDFVMRFLHNLCEKMKPEIDKDIKEIAQDNHLCPMSVLQSGDIASLISKSKKDILDVESSVKNYFSLDACIDGLKLILKCLFDIDLELVEDHDIVIEELWHDDVKKFCIQEGNEILGYIYLDVYARRNKKPSGIYLIQFGRMFENVIYQRPVLVVTSSLSKPSNSKPTLLNILHVDTFFHKMGKAIHCILGQNKFRMISGTRCSDDLYHIPGTLMEYFASDARVLQKFAKHYETKEVIPDDLIEKLVKYKKKFSAYKTQIKIFNAAFDQVCHSQQFLYFSVSEIFNTTWRMHFGSYSKPSKDAEYKFQPINQFLREQRAFAYSRLLSKAITSMIWSKYFKDDPFNQIAGNQFRNEFLVPTAVKPPRDLVEDYLQVKLTPDCLTKAFFE
ncbi:Mitochondrial intermediate peptidase like protein [Argiope bruennichi]|uniref:Mitochondrial intermediate peptidase like protein n=1 Tax=Argiope bruennichi TaxID=94029 RepID=A0A8T0EKJ9_ARGBR|nr:Mitochondrial intermediate peptidase like protein [Argiope bruennichi]